MIAQHEKVKNVTFYPSAQVTVADVDWLQLQQYATLVRYHVFFLINLAKRQLEVAHMGCQVNGAVMAQVARNMTDSYDGFLKGWRWIRK